MKSNLKWNPYVLMKNHEEINNFLNNYLSKEDRILFILGLGFDVRMNLGIKLIQENLDKTKIDCLLISYNEGNNSPSIQYKKFVDLNEKEIVELNLNVSDKKMDLWAGSDNKKHRIGDREAAKLIQSSDIKDYSDIILDISALPRGVFYSLIGTILTILERDYKEDKKNFYILTAENPELDQVIIEKEIDEEVNYTYGFRYGMEGSLETPIIWFPILGEDKALQIRKAHSKINPVEICPILPFPSKDPKRSENLIYEYHSLLFEELKVESQNVLYVPEQNPFEVYRSLCSAIENYFESLKLLGGCRVVISNFSSKLLSLGTIMTAMEFKSRPDTALIVSILNVDCLGYEINEDKDLIELNKDTRIFLTWLNGDPYYE